MANPKRFLSILTVFTLLAWTQSASAQLLGRSYDGFDASATNAVFAAYGDAQSDLADEVDRLEGLGVTVYSSSIDVIDVTHVSYIGGIWHMRIRVEFYINTCGPPCED